MSLFYRLTGVLLLTGCTLGPNFRPPEEPPTEDYTVCPIPENTVSTPTELGEIQTFNFDKDIPGDWWTLFKSSKLTNLVCQALESSPTILAAEATLWQAQENNFALIGTLVYPQFDLNSNATNYGISHVHGKNNLLAPPPPAPGTAPTPPRRLPTILNIYNATVNVSYNLDVFGGIRRQTEALLAGIDYQVYEFRAVQIALIANLSTTAFREASLRGQIEVTNQLIQAQAKQLDITERQLKFGGTAEINVLTQRRELEQTQATLPSLEIQLQQTRHQLAVYAGVYTSDTCLPEFWLSDFSLPQELPVSLPSTLVHQRPDILAAEAQLHVAMANIGVATANFFPQFTLSAYEGPYWIVAEPLIKFYSILWSLGASASQPIFHGGALVAQKRAALVGYELASANYYEAVLMGFQNVADSLVALDEDAKALQAYTKASEDAKRTWDITQHSYNAGGTTLLNLLDAERQYYSTRVGVVQSEAARLADTAALFQALGGGWWNSCEG